MKAKQTVLIAVTLVFAVFAASAFAQGQGKGIGIGVGNQTKVGVGGNAGVKVPGADVGVKTKTDVNAKTSVEGKRPDAKKVDGEATLATRLESNQKLATRLEPMLPTGVALKDAASGFKNQGQFIAALHVSQNLKIPFDQLKAKMTGDSSVSLGAAIKALRPEMSENQATEEVKKAEKAAKETEKQ